MKRNYTAEILKRVAKGEMAVCSIGPTHPVRHLPRSKSDPQPWTDGIFRYSGREVHTVSQEA